jgi:hypothetical protein
MKILALRIPPAYFFLILMLASQVSHAGHWGISVNPFQVTNMGGVNQNGSLDYDDRAGSGNRQFALGVSYAPIRNLEVAWLGYTSFRAIGMNDFSGSAPVPSLDLSSFIDPALLASNPNTERFAQYGMGYNHSGFLYQIRCFTNDWDDYSFMLGLEGGLNQTKVMWYQSPDNANLMKFWGLVPTRFNIPSERFTRGMLGLLAGINVLSNEHLGFLVQTSIGSLLGSETLLENTVAQQMVSGPVTGKIYLRFSLNFSYRF